MKICRLASGGPGLVEGDAVVDLSGFVQTLPARRWSFPLEDPVFARLDSLWSYRRSLGAKAERLPLASTRLLCPVPRPGKIIGAPVNYRAHHEEARQDPALHQGKDIEPIDRIGLFLKAGSALQGPSQPVTLCQPARRTDFEAEVAVVIGRTGRDIPSRAALEWVAGYALALDMTLRGPEERSLRKSADGYAVLGPWVVTPDEIPEPEAIPFSLEVNGELRQQGNTRDLVRSVAQLIAMASSFYTLHPGDIIMTGTPSGAGPTEAGDTLRLESPLLGELRVEITRSATGRAPPV